MAGEGEGGERRLVAPMSGESHMSVGDPRRGGDAGGVATLISLIVSSRGGVSSPGFIMATGGRSCFFFPSGNKGDSP